MNPNPRESTYIPAAAPSSLGVLVSAIFTVAEALEVIADETTGVELYVAAANALWTRTIAPRVPEELAMRMVREMLDRERTLSTEISARLAPQLFEYDVDNGSTDIGQLVRMFWERAEFSLTWQSGFVESECREYDLRRIKRLCDLLAARARYHCNQAASPTAWHSARSHRARASEATALLETLFCDEQAMVVPPDDRFREGHLVQASLLAVLNRMLPAVSVRLIDLALESGIARQSTALSFPQFAGFREVYTEARADAFLELRNLTVDNRLSENPSLSEAHLWRLYARYMKSSPVNCGFWLAPHAAVRAVIGKSDSWEAAQGVMSRAVDKKETDWITSELCALVLKGFSTENAHMPEMDRFAPHICKTLGEPAAIALLARRDEKITAAVLSYWARTGSDGALLDTLLGYPDWDVRIRLLEGVRLWSPLRIPVYRDKIIPRLLKDRSIRVRQATREAWYPENAN